MKAGTEDGAPSVRHSDAPKCSATLHDSFNDLAHLSTLSGSVGKRAIIGLFGLEVHN